MRTKTELDFIKSFVDNAYNNYGNCLHVSLDKPYNPSNPELGYSYRYLEFDKNSDRNLIVYNIVCAPIGIERTDYRVLLHEYGHIYLGHLDGIYEELDVQACNVFRDYRDEIIDSLNKSLGIDWADKLIERVIDDKVLNHSLHNIAMDMEVNTKVLSTEDVEEMEMDITKTMPNFQEESLKRIIDDPNTSEEDKKKASDILNRMENEAKIKLIVPCRYHMTDGTPFPDEQTYVWYFIEIIKHLDQFIKMMINIKNGGNGDTSQVTDEQVQQALNNGQGGMQSLDDLMQQMGMSDGNGNTQGKCDTAGTGNNNSSDPGQHNTINTGGYKGNGEKSSSPYHRGDIMKDHGSDSRDEADRKREAGQIVAGGGLGCGSGGGPGVIREVTKQDEVDTAIDEVIKSFKSRVVKRRLEKDSVWYWNRGINRSVLAPAYRSQVTITTEPKIVYLIDISGSMDTELVDRILGTIAKKMRHIGTGRGLKYDVISWSTRLGEHLKDIDPKKGVPRISCGGGTWMAGGIQYFKDHYDENAVLVLISDFCDDLGEWHKVEKTMPKYDLWAFNYGGYDYGNDQKFDHIKVRNFNNRSRNW